jgi:hypothetical protein
MMKESAISEKILSRIPAIHSVPESRHQEAYDPIGTELQINTHPERPHL